MARKVEVKSLSRVQLFATRGLQPTKLLRPWYFSRQEYWSGLPFPPPEDLPDPGIEPTSLSFFVSCICRWILFHQLPLRSLIKWQTRVFEEISNQVEDRAKKVSKMEHRYEGGTIRKASQIKTKIHLIRVSESQTGYTREEVPLQGKMIENFCVLKKAIRY